jgi:hypothetical protein
MMKTTLTHLIILCFLAPILNAHAVEYQSPRTLALGGAGRGGPLLNDSIYLNPSYASYNPIYAASGGYTWTNNHGRNYNGSVQDSRTELFQGGVGYTEHETFSAINLGLSKEIVKQLGVGLGSKVIVDHGTNQLTSDFIFSTSYIATRWLYASIIVDNLVQNQNAIQRNLFRTFYVGMKFIPTQEVEFFVDPLYSPQYTAGKNAGVSLGVEIGITGDFFLRAGKFINGEISYIETRGTGYGLGVGWIGPKINFDYGLSRATATDSGLGQILAHTLSTTIFL